LKRIFGILLIKGIAKGDSITAKHNKYIFFSFVGSGVPELVQAQTGPLKAQVQKFFGATALTLDLNGSTLEEQFTENQVGFRLMHSTGTGGEFRCRSHKADEFDYGDGQVFKASTFVHSDEAEEEDADFD